MHLIALAFSMLLAGALGASGPTAPQPRAVITIDFVATMGDGQHAAGLTAADLSLKIGGRERPIRDLEVVTVKAGHPVASPSAQATASALPPPYGETLKVGEEGRRSILLLVDEGTLFGMEPVLRDAVAKLVASLYPADRLGVASTRPDSISVPLTTDHQKVRAAVDSLSLGRGNPSLCFGGVARQVVSLAQLLPAGRASTLALLSRGGGIVNPQGSGALVASGECLIRREELLPIANVISATQVNYHVFNVGAAGASSALEDFAGATGAQTSVLSFAEAGGLARTVQAVTQFYRATVEADGGRRDQLERVELRVTRGGVRVHGPTHVSLEPVKPPIVDAASLLRGSAVRSDLPLRIAAFASKNAGARSEKLLVVVEPAEAGTTFTEAIVSVVGASGEVAGQWTARPEDLARVPLIAALPVVPGSYRVRAALVDGRNRAALAEYVTDMLQGSGEVKMSGLVLGVSPKGEFTPRLLFGNEPSGIAYLEIYNARASANVDVTFELAASPGGPVLAKIPAQMSAGQTHTAIGQIPVGTLPVGDTLVRAIVTIDGAPAGQTVRTLRKSAR